MAVARSPAHPPVPRTPVGSPDRIQRPAALLLHRARRALHGAPRFLLLGAIGCLFVLAVAIALLANVVRPG